MQPKITGVHHIALKACGVADYEKTIHFYHDILGMPIARTWGTPENPCCMIDTGAGLLEIFANGTEYPEQGPLRHLAFEVEDTDVCIEAVRAAGYTVTIEPKDIVIASEPPYPARIGFCIGPVGEEVEFFHVK
jgi:glyoxylase I family protein